MAQWFLLLASCVTIGCAAHRAPLPTVSADWSTVQALAPGTQLAVYVGEQESRHGRLESVSDENLVISGPRAIEVLPRTRIQRIAIRTSTGLSRRPPIVKTAVIAAVVSAALAWLAQAMAENPPQNRFRWSFVVAATAGGAAVGAMRAPAETFRERLVYMGTTR